MILFSKKYRKIKGRRNGIKLRIRSFLKIIIYFFFGMVSFVKIRANLNKFYCIKYADMLYLSYFNKNLFYKYKYYFEEENKQRIINSGKVKIGFLTYTPSIWSLEKLYNKLNENKKCEVDILVGVFNSLADNVAQKEYNNAIKYFRDGKKSCVPVDANMDISHYDIIFYMTPYKFRNEKVNIKNLSVRTLVSYISYGFMLCDIPEKLELPAYLLSWKYFCDSQFYKEFIKRYSRVYTNNVIYCGYPKMDIFFENKNKDKYKKNKKKVIIYAPHHSVIASYGVGHSTFASNYKYMLQLAKKYKEETYWIYKPHPLLEGHCIKAGIFNTSAQYENYLQQWSELENGKICVEGPYFDSFLKSDCMITDSVSFLAEYQYVNRPLLLLEKKGAVYNEFGNAIKEIIYKCPGDDYLEIERFICNVIVDCDPKKKEREDFFNRNLNYFKKNGMLANEYIYNLLCEELYLER